MHRRTFLVGLGAFAGALALPNPAPLVFDLGANLVLPEATRIIPATRVFPHWFQDHLREVLEVHVHPVTDDRVHGHAPEVFLPRSLLDDYVQKVAERNRWIDEVHQGLRTGASISLRFVADPEHRA